MDIFNFIFEKITSETTTVLFLLTFGLFIYLSVLIVVYISVLFYLTVQNERMAKKNEIVVFHKFHYSWMTGVTLEPIIIKQEKRALEVNTNPIKNTEKKDGVTEVSPHSEAKTN